MPYPRISFALHPKGQKKADSAFRRLSREIMPLAAEDVAMEFAMKFRANIRSAIMSNAPWASSGWKPYVGQQYQRIKKRRGYISRYWQATGYLGRHLNTNSKPSVTRTQRTVRIDLMEGIPSDAIYPGTKGRTSTSDVFAYNEFGSKNQRPPARPVVYPAYWRTAQLFNYEDRLARAFIARM